MSGSTSWLEVGEEAEEKYLHEVLKDNAIDDVEISRSITFSLYTVGYSFDIRAPKLGAVGNSNLLRKLDLFRFTHKNTAVLLLKL